MKNIGIIAAMELEIESLKEKISFETQVIRGFTYYTTSMKGKNIVVACCGIGKTNAAACTQALIDRFNVDCIINTGIAGGLHQDLKIGDVVISSNVTHHDVNKEILKNCFPFKEYFEGDQQLVELASRACQQQLTEEWNYHVGRIISGEFFVECGEMKKALVESYDPHCVEMEGAAIGHVSYINNIPFVVIRSISDKADDGATIDFESFKIIAANRSAEIVLIMLKKLDLEC